MELRESKYILLIFLVFLFLPPLAFSQTLDEKNWEKLKNELDYGDVENKKKTEAPKTEHEAPPSVQSWNWGNAVNVIVITGVAIIIILIVLRLLGIRSLSAKVKKQAGNSRVLEKEEEAELQNLIPLHEELLLKGDYRGAIRALYLQSLKDLHDAGHIVWKKDKTNADYLREMRPKTQFSIFRLLTRSFEIAWYGEFPVSEDAYRSVKGHFDQLNQNNDG